MRIGSLEVGTNITIRAHINDVIFTTETTIATVRNSIVILRLNNVEQFDRYAEKTQDYSLCLKSDSDVNYISDIIQVQHSASNPWFIAVDKGRGPCILLNKQVPVGTFGYIDIWNPMTGKSRAFQAKIVNCKQVRPNLFKTGILFENAEQWILDFINDFQNNILDNVS